MLIGNSFKKSLSLCCSLCMLLLLSTSTASAEKLSKNNYATNPMGAALAEKIPDKYCTDHLKNLHSGSPATIRTSIDKEFSAYLPLVEQSLAYRDETIKTAARLKAKIAAGKPLSGEDLDRLNSGTVAHLELREELYKVAEAHECWQDGSLGDLKESGINDELRLKGVMLSLSAALILYDNYLLAISVMDEDGKLRRFLNERDSGYDIGAAELAKITLSYNSPYNRHRVRSAIKFYEREIKKMSASFLDDKDMQYLDLLISQSPSYSMTKKFSPLYVIGQNLKFFTAITGDTLEGLGKEGVNLFSMIFGNTLGLVESRKGKLYGRADVTQKVSGELKAGDILLEKTPFRLTDKFIPGHWGHVAIWTGTEKELKKMEIWDHPVVKKYQRQIRSGNLVIEALRSGVEMNTLDHFMNIDDIAVLRGKRMTKKERMETVLRAFRQVGKAYDFNFDVETTDRIVCSELVYTTFDGIKWPTEKTLGRSTISPDNVATKALKEGPLELIILYHDGALVERQPVQQMARLMGEK